MIWKDTNKDLPYDCQPVLVYDKIMKSCTVAYLMYDRENNPISWVIVDFDEYEQTINFKDISHWMSLPESPKNE